MRPGTRRVHSGAIPVHPGGMLVYAGSFDCVPSIPERNEVSRTGMDRKCKARFKRVRVGHGRDYVP